ncbi:MAG TPA: PEP-CTERM sorting domain-containing protein [Gemmataceae bacterium]|nr:PEP-CTERM sorting domain-containing protein [Gemmataceae bacterium]
MQSLLWRSPGLVCALLLLTPGASRADFYSNWSFSWNFNPVPPNAAGFIPADAGVAPGGSATGGAQFAATSGASGGPVIPVATVSTTSAATTTPDSFQGTPFAFGVTITDNASNASGTLTFDGALHGGLTATSSSAVATFSLDPASPSSLVLSGHTYQVAVDPSLALGAPNQLPKLLNATVAVDASNTGGGGGTPPPVQTVPEPSSFALAGIAAAFALAGRRRVRAARPAA